MVMAFLPQNIEGIPFLLQCLLSGETTGTTYIREFQRKNVTVSFAHTIHRAHNTAFNVISYCSVAMLGDNRRPLWLPQFSQSGADR